MKADKPVIGFCFARGGSKGVPGKNLKMLGTKSLVGHSIECGQNCEAIEEFFVSTDCSDIAVDAESAGAEIIKRGIELSSDTAKEIDAWKHAIREVKERREISGDFWFVSLPATAPLRSVDDVNAAIDRAVSSECDGVISVAPANRSPFFNMVTKDDSGFVSLAGQSPSLISRRQDCPEVFDITTVVYVMNSRFVEGAESLFDGKLLSVLVPKERAIDIDDEVDLEFARFLYEKSNLNK